MDNKKSAKAEKANLPPAAKRALRSTSATVALMAATAPAQKQSSRKTLLVATREQLDKEGFLKLDEHITVSSLLEAFRLIHERYNTKMPPKVQKTMMAFKMALWVLVVEQRVEPDPNMAECTELISAKVEEAIDKHMAKLSSDMETSLANQKDMQSSSK